MKVVGKEHEEVASSICAPGMRVAGVLFLLTACSSGPPWTLNSSPDEITLRWYPDSMPNAAADAVAQTHCRNWGKNAELVAYTQDGSAQLGNYRCR
jgi:hypothetical protein